jgi:hypothetical protein
MSAHFTIATTSDGFGNLKKLCKKYELDRLVAQPDFGVKSGYVFTAFKGDKFVNFRLADITEQTIDHATKTAAVQLAEPRGES